MEELCTACLCIGRNLHFIGETGFYDLYSQILNEIPVFDTSQVCIRVCWECRAVLRRLHEFKTRVKQSYELLMGLHESRVQTLARAPRLSIHRPPPVSLPLVVKTEVDVKEEDEEHCEETFVNDYHVGLQPAGEHAGEEQPVPEHPAPSVEQKHKTRARTKVKSKKPKQKKEVKRKTHAKKRRKKSTSTEESFDCLDVGNDSDVDCKNNVTEGVLENVNEGDLEQGAAKEGVVNEGVGKGLEKNDREELRCPDCEEQFDVESDLIAHIEANHKEAVSGPNGTVPVRGPAVAPAVVPAVVPSRPQCAECGKVFSSRKTYRYHLNVLHKGQNKHQCPRCGKVYQWKSNLGRHIRSHKARDAGELHCSLCDKRFASVATYRQHLRVSRRHVTENDFSFECSVCGKKFVNKTRLQDHVDWEHLNKIKFQCQLCHKPFKCHTSLYVHLQNVHRNKEKKDNLCHVCGKSYQNAAKLKYHIVAMHTSETPYQCTECTAAFGWYSSLYRHVREVHQKMKLQSSKCKKSKRKPVELLPPPGPLPPRPASLRELL